MDRKSGGFAAMGRSVGNPTAFSLLGYPDVVRNESYRRLEPNSDNQFYTVCISTSMIMLALDAIVLRRPTRSRFWI